MTSNLDLTVSPEALTATLVDIPSVSGNEARLADLVESALRQFGHLEVQRDGDAVIARTRLDRTRRVLLAGHLDTVPIAENLPSRRDHERLHGCGSSDMKSGLAVMLRLAASVREPRHDVTYIFYDNEEVEASRSGLARLTAHHRDWLDGDLAILMEPTAGHVEAGCQGTLRVMIAVTGRRAHSARSWLGENAIHRAGDLLTRLAQYEPRRVTIDGCEYREGVNAVRIEGGVAGNVVPDRCTVTVNFRFAPDRSEVEALSFLQELIAPFEAVLTDSAPGALPNLRDAAVHEFLDAVGLEPLPKFGWTDVARFSELGVPALNYGPGEPDLAHTREEYVELRRIGECERVLRNYLTE